MQLIDTYIRTGIHVMQLIDTYIYRYTCNAIDCTCTCTYFLNIFNLYGTVSLNSASFFFISFVVIRNYTVNKISKYSIIGRTVLILYYPYSTPIYSPPV